MYDVKGKSIRDIMNIAEGDFLSFTEREQKAVTSRLVSAANKRARRFVKGTGEQINLKSYTSKGKFSVKGKTKKSGELADEFKRVKEFLSRKTSSLRGYKEFKKKLEEESKYVGKRKDEVPDYTDLDIDFETGEIIEPYQSEEDYEPFELSTGDVWQATDDVLEGSRSELETKIVYEIHDMVQDFMSERRSKKYNELSANQKEKLKEQIDKYIQDNSTDYGTFSGNM